MSDAGGARWKRGSARFTFVEIRVGQPLLIEEATTNYTKRMQFPDFFV